MQAIYIVQHTPSASLPPLSRGKYNIEFPLERPACCRQGYPDENRDGVYCLKTLQSRCRPGKCNLTDKPGRTALPINTNGVFVYL